MILFLRGWLASQIRHMLPKSEEIGKVNRLDTAKQTLKDTNIHLILL